MDNKVIGLQPACWSPKCRCDICTRPAKVTILINAGLAVGYPRALQVYKHLDDGHHPLEIQRMVRISATGTPQRSSSPVVQRCGCTTGADSSKSLPRAICQSRSSSHTRHSIICNFDPTGRSSLLDFIRFSSLLYEPFCWFPVLTEKSQSKCDAN
jgi:hypothetical protein